ncbi:MAG: PKD domain-containing protein, partial [Candidatus Eremiobacteraeota bacterium]|nr:PKD domain-containing protein [Candidatus Eremiobacteraeota bacterium]
LKGGSAPYSVSWRMNNAGIGSGTSSSYRFSRAGTYRLTATVRDRNGRTKSASRTFNVRGQSSPLNFSIRASNVRPKPGQTVTFSISRISGGTQPYRYTWTLSRKGTIGGSTSARYTFRMRGSYVITLRVTDSRGQTRSQSLNIKVM